MKKDIRLKSYVHLYIKKLCWNDGNRTHDLMCIRHLLSPLSYVPIKTPYRGLRKRGHLKILVVPSGFEPLY